MMYAGLPASLPLLLTSHHSMRVTVRLLDLDHRPIGAPISNRILEGQVNVDFNAEVTRSLTMKILDPSGALDFDSDSPADGALYADRMLSVSYGVQQSGTNGGRWIDVPVFTGPVTKFSRDGEVVSVECQGKESLSLTSPWGTYVGKKNRRKRDVIVEVMQQAGERHFSFIEPSYRMPKDAVLTAEQTYWGYARSIAASMGLQLFYNGAGRLVLREYPRTTLFTFRDGTGGSIISKPSVEFDVSNVRNAIRVIGGKPKGSKKQIRYNAVAPPSHPLSPIRLGRGGRPRWIAETINDPKIGSVAEARRVGNAQLAARLAMTASVKFESLVIPHLEPADTIAVSTERFALGTRLDSFTIPLTASGTMAVGFNRRMHPNRKAIR